MKQNPLPYVAPVLALAVLLSQPVMGQDPVRRTATRIIFEVGGRVVSLIVEKRADMTIGILGAAAWDGTRAAVAEAFSFGASKNPPPTDATSCQVIGTSSIHCSGVGKFDFDFKNPTPPNINPLVTQSCSIFLTPLAKLACESNNASAPTQLIKPLAPSYLNMSFEPVKPVIASPDFSRFLNEKYLQDAQPSAPPVPPAAVAPIQPQPVVKPVPVFEQSLFKAGDPFVNPYRFDGNPAPGR
jgi:hypothetical protein